MFNIDESFEEIEAVLYAETPTLWTLSALLPKINKLRHDILNTEYRFPSEKENDKAKVRKLEQQINWLLGIKQSEIDKTIPPVSFAIEELSDELLDKLFHGVIFEMNRRKAKRQGVDVGFWSSDGEYKVDIQPVTPEEMKEINAQAQKEQE